MLEKGLCGGVEGARAEVKTAWGADGTNGKIKGPVREGECQSAQVVRVGSFSFSSRFPPVLLGGGLGGTVCERKRK